MMDCKGPEFDRGDWVILWGYCEHCEYCLKSYLDGCLDFLGLIWFGFSTFAGLGVVVLFATFVTCESEFRALSRSGFTMVSFVGWSCAVSTCVGTRSGVSFRVRLGTGGTFILLIRRF